MQQSDFVTIRRKDDQRAAFGAQNASESGSEALDDVGTTPPYIRHVTWLASKERWIEGYQVKLHALDGPEQVARKDADCVLETVHRHICSGTANCDRVDVDADDSVPDPAGEDCDNARARPHVEGQRSSSIVDLGSCHRLAGDRLGQESPGAKHHRVMDIRQDQDGDTVDVV